MATRGKQLTRLIDALGLTQEMFADIAGVARPTVNKAAKDKIAWRSGPTMNSMALKLGVNYDELFAYLDDKTPIEDILIKARGEIEKEKASRSTTDRLQSLAERAVKLADVDAELAPAVSRILVLIMKRDGGDIPMAELVLDAKSQEKDLRDKLNRRLRSHKTSSSKPPSGP